MFKFFDGQTDRQTDGRTDRVITIGHPPSGGALITLFCHLCWPAPAFQRSCYDQGQPTGFLPCTLVVCRRTALHNTSGCADETLLDQMCSCNKKLSTNVQVYQVQRILGLHVSWVKKCMSVYGFPMTNFYTNLPSTKFYHIWVSGRKMWCPRVFLLEFGRRLNK